MFLIDWRGYRRRPHVRARVRLEWRPPPQHHVAVTAKIVGALVRQAGHAVDGVVDGAQAVSAARRRPRTRALAAAALAREKCIRRPK